MKKTVIVSTNNNPDYMFYAPFQEKAWNSYGWDLCIITTHDVNPDDLKVKNSQIIKMDDIPELRSETVAQACRLYAANYFSEGLLMTCDMDLIPMQDYWHPEEDKITVYGFDLTWGKFYPMGYIAMSADNWRKVMKLTGDTKTQMIADAKEIGLASSDKWEDWWNHDWTLGTKRLKEVADSIVLKDRGRISIAGADLAVGRVDRYNWKETQKQPNWIDAHCETNNVFHEAKLGPFLEVYNKVHGELTPSPIRMDLL